MRAQPASSQRGSSFRVRGKQIGPRGKQAWGGAGGHER